MSETELKEAVNNNLKKIADPHMGVSIVEMGLIKEITIDEENKTANVTISPTNPGCMSVANIAMTAKIESEKVEGINTAIVTVIDHMMADNINEMVNKKE